MENSTSRVHEPGRATIVWGLSSSIAIYRALEAIRIFVREGHRVIPMLSQNATAFIQPLLLEALTGETVYSHVMRLTENHRVIHTSLARQADVLVFAPASANLIAALANGLAHDLLTTTFLAYEGWTVVAPAMNVHMWRHPVTQQNVRRLRELGIHIVEPAVGPQIDGDVGPGRLAEPEVIADAVYAILSRTRDLANQTVLVTAGPTREPIDPVRYLSNRSSGKMGFAIAESALRRGARVILITGPTHLIPHPDARTIHVETAEEMFNAVKTYMNQANWIIKCAAVADFKPSRTLPKKARKKELKNLTLTPTPDILAYIGQHRKPHQIVVGFAAETHQYREHAREKLVSKHLDAIALNPVDRDNTGFEVDTNQLTLLTHDGHDFESPLLSKHHLADWFWETLLAWIRTRDAASSNLMPDAEMDDLP